MKVLNRKTLVMLLVAILLVLGACSSNSNNSGTSNATNNPNNSTESPSPSTSTDEPVTLTMLVSGAKAAEGEDFELETLPRLVREKFPNVTLEVQKLPDEQYYTTVKTKLGAGEGADIFLVFPKLANMGAIEVAKAGYAADLSELSFWDRVSQAAKNDMSYDGKPYAVAKGMDILGTFYNKDLFEQAGITEVPTDWPSFLDASEKLKAAGITPIVMGDKDPWRS